MKGKDLRTDQNFITQLSKVAPKSGTILRAV